MRALAIMFVLSWGLLIFVLASQANAGQSPNDPATVATVDITRYAGQWKEIAHSPNAFQRGCVRSAAEYAVLSPAKISVHNICYKADNTVSDIRGEATIPDLSQPGKLKVVFRPDAVGDYWIVRLDPNYQWAVVSGPARKDLFILSRTAPMSAELLKSILADLTADSYDVSDLFYDQY